MSTLTYLETINPDECIGNSLSAFNSNFTTTDEKILELENTITNLQVAAAWASFDGSVISDHYNISNIELTSGQCSVTFQNNLPDSTYAVVLSESSDLSATPHIGQVHTKTISGFKMTWFNTSGAVAEPNGFDFVVFNV